MSTQHSSQAQTPPRRPSPRSWNSQPIPSGGTGVSPGRARGLPEIIANAYTKTKDVAPQNTTLAHFSHSKGVWPHTCAPAPCAVRQALETGSHGSTVHQPGPGCWLWVVMLVPRCRQTKAALPLHAHAWPVPSEFARLRECPGKVVSLLVAADSHLPKAQGLVPASPGSSTAVYSTNHEEGEAHLLLRLGWMGEVPCPKGQWPAGLCRPCLEMLS